MHRATCFAAVILLSGLHALAHGQTTAHEDTGMEGIPRAPADGGPRRWQVVYGAKLDVRESPSLKAPIININDDRTVLSNLGCEAHGARVWCSVENLRGKMRGYALAEFLRPAVSADGTVAVGIDGSALRARKGDFDARGLIRCAQERGQEMGECMVSVARGDGGDAAAVASFANGFRRILYFSNGEFISANATMSGSGSDTDWSKEGGVHAIRVDDQRYELHNELIFGR